jgi:hypothetical protein
MLQLSERWDRRASRFLQEEVREAKLHEPSDVPPGSLGPPSPTTSSAKVANLAGTKL